MISFFFYFDFIFGWLNCEFATWLFVFVVRFWLIVDCGGVVACCLVLYFVGWLICCEVVDGYFMCVCLGGICCLTVCGVLRGCVVGDCQVFVWLRFGVV